MISEVLHEYIVESIQKAVRQMNEESVKYDQPLDPDLVVDYDTSKFEYLEEHKTWEFKANCKTNQLVVIVRVDEDTLLQESNVGELITNVLWFNVDPDYEDPSYQVLVSVSTTSSGSEVVRDLLERGTKKAELSVAKYAEKSDWLVKYETGKLEFGKNLSRWNTIYKTNSELDVQAILLPRDAVEGLLEKDDTPVTLRDDEELVEVIWWYYVTEDLDDPAYHEVVKVERISGPFKPVHSVEAVEYLPSRSSNEYDGDDDIKSALIRVMYKRILDQFCKQMNYEFKCVNVSRADGLDQWNWKYIVTDVNKRDLFVRMSPGESEDDINTLYIEVDDANDQEIVSTCVQYDDLYDPDNIQFAVTVYPENK